MTNLSTFKNCTANWMTVSNWGFYYWNAGTFAYTGLEDD